MNRLTLTPMTSDEVDVLIARTAREFAAEQVAAGNWPEESAAELGRAETARLLPQGGDTPGMSILSAFDGENRVGYVWLNLEPRISSTGEAWIYDIEVAAELRGRGYGRLLLEAAEDEARRAGATYLGLNVFGANRVARSLYEGSGYEVKTMQMRKAL
ncbi:MAG: GNAT family N-acetyltransferase [Acidobacteriota bacterium]|nr:GNAT family N-acetyltransferase [Acidobacteriota bacterium]